MAYKDDKHSIFGDNFDEKLLKALSEFATVQQEQQTDATFTDTVNKLQQIGKTADQTTKKVDELGDHIDKLDGKEANVNINTTSETEENSQLKGIRNSIDKKYVEQKRIDLNQLASKWKSEQSKEQDTDKKIDLLVKAQTAEKLKTSSTDQIKTSDIKAIIESAAEGNQQLIDQANKMYGSGENYSAFKGKVIEAISDGLQTINTKVDESFVEMSDVLNTAISQYKKNNDLTSATNVMKIANQILARNKKYEFTDDQKNTFVDIGKNPAYQQFINGLDSKSQQGQLSRAYKIITDQKSGENNPSFIKEQMDQLIEISKAISSISSAIDRNDLTHTKGDNRTDALIAQAYRTITKGQTSENTLSAITKIITNPNNSVKLSQNSSIIKNLIDVFSLGDGVRSKSSKYKQMIEELTKYVNDRIVDNAFDYDTTKAKGKSGTGSGNDNSESAEINQKELKQQKKLLQDAKKKIESEKIKQLGATQTADEYIDQYKSLISSIVAYRSDVEKFRAKFGQEADPISGYPDEYDETTLQESVGNIFTQISDFNNKVTMSKSAASNPEKQQKQANDIYDAYNKLTNAISSFENTFGVKFKQDAQIQTSVGKYVSIKNGFTPEISDKTLSFVTENKEISDKRVEMDKLLQDVIDYQDKLAPLVAKLKPAIDTEGAEVNKSDLDAFTELVDKIKTAGETISGMNMREAMKSKLGTKAQSKLNGVQTWEEYIETLNTRTIIDDTGEKDEKKSGDGEGNGSGDGSGSGTSLEEIQKALEPVEGKITDVKTAVEQLDTDLGNKLDTINTTIENNKPDVNLDVDSVYDKFRDDVVAIRTGVEKVASNFDQGENPSSTKKTEVITEYLANLLTDSNEIMIPVDYKKEASLFYKGRNEALKVVDELESKYGNDTEKLFKQIDNLLIDYLKNTVDLNVVNDAFDVVPAQGYVQYMTDYLKTQDNEKYFKNSRFNTERVNVNDDSMSDIFNNSFIEEAERTGRWISDFETSLNRAEQIIKELTKPHSLPMIIESLEDLKSIISNDYFNPSDYIRAGGYEFNYLSPVTGKSQSIYFDQEEGSDSQASGYPRFIELIDKDLNFLKNLLDAKNANEIKADSKQPTAEKKTVNTMLSELIAQIGELSKKMDQDNNFELIEELKKEINPDGGTKLNQESIDALVNKLVQTIPTTIDSRIEQSQYQELIGKIEAVQTVLGEELKVAINDTQMNTLQQSDITKTNAANRQSEDVYDKYKYILDLAAKDGLNDVSEKFGKYDKPDKIRWDKRDSERYSLIDRGTEMFSHKTIVGVLDKYVDALGKKYGLKWVEELAKSESTSGIQNGKDAAEIINRMSSILNDILIGKGSEWTGMSAESTKSLQNALISQGDSIVDAEGTVHTSLENIFKLQEDCSAAQEMIASLGKLYTESNVTKTMGFLNYDKPPAYGNANFFKQLYVQQNHPELQSEKPTTATSIGELIDSNTKALNKNTAALEKLSNEGLNLSQDNVSVETEDVLAQIQETRRTLQDTQTATEAAGFKDIADTINNQVIPQIQKKNDNIIAEKKLVDKTVTAEVNRFTELANTIKNKVGEAITAKNTLLENDLNNTKAIVDQQMEYVRQLVDSIRDMFAMADNPEDMTKANALILEFKATENLTDNYRKEVANTLVELDKLWNTGKIEEYQNKFIELMHILESHQKQQKTNVNKDELTYLKEEAQQIKDVLGYTRGVKGQKTPTLISKEMIDSLGSSVDLLNQIYGAKGKGWRQAQEHEKGITWQDLRFMDAEDKRYTGATIVNDQDMEDAEFFMTYATKLLDTLEKIKNLSVETEIGGMLGNEQYYAQATNELENRLNSVVGKNYNAFPNPVENDTLEGFEEVITDAEAQQKAADELEQRLTANGAQTTIVQIIDLLSTKMSELKKYIDGITNETTSAMFANLASDIGAIYQAITLIPEGGMPDLLGSNKDNVSKLANLQSSIQSIYASITNNQQATMDAPLSNLNVTLSPEGANQLTTQIANAIAAGEYTIKKFKVADDTRVASKIQAVINSEDPIVVSKFVVNPQKSINFSNQLSQIIANSGSISLKSFDVNSANIGEVRQDIETKLNEKPIKLNNWEAGNFKRINNLVAEGVAKSISDDIQKGLDEKKLILKNWEIKGIQAKINEALKQSPVTVEDFKVGNLANAKQDIAKKIGATKITFDENNPIDIDALNVKTITISDEVAQKIKPIPVTVNPTNLDELVTQITDAFEVGTSKVIKLPNQAAYNTQKTNIAELVGEFETVVKSAQDYAEAIYSITDAIKSVFEQSKPTLNEINASVNNMLNGLHLLNGTNQQESKSNTELYYEDLIKNAKNAQMRMQAGNTSVRGEAYISAMNDEYTKLISLLEQAKDGEGEFDSKLASDIKEQRTVISEMENSFKELEKTANEAEKKLAAAEARIAQAAADNLESPYTEEENQLLQDLRDMIARARSNVSQGTSGEINSALREALEMVYENVNTDGLDQSMLDRLREPVVVDYSDPEKYVKAYAESGLKVKEQLEDANSNLVKALTETQRDDLSKKYYDFAELLQKIVDGNVELNADTDKEVSAAYKEIMDAFNKSIGKSSTQQNQKQKVIDVNLLNKYKKELEKYNNQLAKYHDGTAVKYQDKINSYSPEIDRIIEGSKNITDDTSPEAVALKQSYDKLIQNIKTMKDGSEGGSGGLTNYLDTKKSAAEIDRLNKKFDELIAKIQVYVKNNSKLTTDPEVKTQFQALLSDAQSATRSAAEYDRLNASLSQLKATVSNKGLTGRSLGDDIKYIAERIGIKAALSNSIYKVIGYFRQMVTTVTELDTGMTALKRVTQETQRVYTDFLKSTTSNAQALGATMSEVVNATTSFSKLGFNLQEAQTLANNAIIYKTVGDIDINTATNDMISTMKAFNMEASQSEHIVDAFDIINNKYAISAQQVGEGLKGSAAALATANNTFEESAAM